MINFFHLYAVKADPIVHYLEHGGYVLQFRSQAQPYNIITVFHDLHARAFEIGMRNASINRITQASRQLLVSEKTRDQDSDIIRKFFLQPDQNVFSLRHYRIYLLKELVNHIPLSLLRQTEQLCNNLFDASTIFCGQKGKRVAFAQPQQLFFGDDPKKALKLCQGQEHLWLLVIIGIYSWFV